MSNDPYLDEFPAAEEKVKESKSTTSGDKAVKESRIQLIGERLSHAGLGETVYRLGTAFLTIALILLAVVGMRLFYLRFQKADVSQPREAALAAEAPTPTPTAVPAIMPAFAGAMPVYQYGISRLALIHTTIPSRPRTEITTYTIQKGDTIF